MKCLNSRHTRWVCGRFRQRGWWFNTQAERKQNQTSIGRPLSFYEADEDEFFWNTLTIEGHKPLTSLYRELSQAPARPAASVTNAKSPGKCVCSGMHAAAPQRLFRSALNIQATSDIDMPLKFRDCIFVMDSRGPILFAKQTATRSAVPLFWTEVNATKSCMFDICDYTKLPLIQVSSV